MSYMIIASAFECDPRYVCQSAFRRDRVCWSTQRRRAIENPDLEACRALLDRILDDNHQLCDLLVAFSISPRGQRKITLEIHELLMSGGKGRVMDSHTVSVPLPIETVAICMQAQTC